MTTYGISDRSVLRRIGRLVLSLHHALPEGLGAEFDPFGSSSFYPSAWHLVAAIAVDALGAPVSFAANAANVVFAAIIYPWACSRS